EKSQVINLRKRESEFLGFTIRANRKGKKRVAHTGLKESKKRKIKETFKKYVRRLKASPTTQNALLFNSFVLGIHNYFNRATHVNNEFSRLSYDVRAFIYNRLKMVGKFGYPANAPPTYKKFYTMGTKTFRIANVYLFQLADVKTKNAMNFSPRLNPFTPEGRTHIYKQLRSDIQREIALLLESNIQTRSVEYMDNRISRYSMKMGQCEITGVFLQANEVHCHHYTPVYLGGDDTFNNLRILHKDIHTAIHQTDEKAIHSRLKGFDITKPVIKKLNTYREKCGLKPITQFQF
ncbi:HNH endonuclease signature motif containing protein, partial [Gracilibacillus sp. D59]|uniref:HNH endonuclease signature motif containing protein n=1 Tax=Gracilibacillus sp. D59 TaxID=3457434 RepID=UPI003FCCEC63